MLSFMFLSRRWLNVICARLARSHSSPKQLAQTSSVWLRKSWWIILLTNMHFLTLTHPCSRLDMSASRFVTSAQLLLVQGQGFGSSTVTFSTDQEKIGEIKRGMGPVSSTLLFVFFLADFVFSFLLLLCFLTNRKHWLCCLVMTSENNVFCSARRKWIFPMSQWQSISWPS